MNTIRPPSVARSALRPATVPRSAVPSPRVPVPYVRGLDCYFSKTSLAGTDDTGILWAEKSNHAAAFPWDFGRYRLALALAPVLTAYSEPPWTPEPPDVYGLPVGAPSAKWELWLVDSAGNDTHRLATAGACYSWDPDLIALPEITAYLHFYGPPLGFMDLGVLGGELRGNGLRLRTLAENGADAAWRLAEPFRVLLMDAELGESGVG